MYSFFGGKDGLFAAIVEERCARILSAFGDPEVAGSDVLSALAHIAWRYMEVVMAPDAVGFYRLIIAEGVRFPELTRTFHQTGPDRTNAHLAGMLSDWCERGLIRLDDPQFAAVQFFDLVSSFSTSSAETCIGARWPASSQRTSAPRSSAASIMRSKSSGTASELTTARGEAGGR